MAKFTGGYQPITWRNVPTGNPSAFFNGVTQAGDVLFDQQGTLNEIEDSRLTNEAIAGSLAGNPTPFNRRVDQTALQQADGYADTLESNLLSAGVDRLGTKADTAQTLAETEEMPARLKAYLAEVEAQKAATKNAKERNRLQAQINDALAAEEARKVKIREEKDAYTRASQKQHKELYGGYLQEAISQRLGPDGDINDLSQAERDFMYIDAKERTDHDMARDVTAQKIRGELGTSPEAFESTPTGQALSAAQQQNRTEAEWKRAFLGEEQDKYGSNLEAAIYGDYMAGGLDANDNFIPIDPKSQVMKGGEFNSMAQGKARLNSEVDFVFAELTPANKKSLTDVVSTLPATVLRKLTDNVMAPRQDEGGRGKMSSDNFARKFIDAAYEYQQGYKSLVDTYTGANKESLKPNEIVAIHANKVVRSDSVVDESAPADTTSIEERLTARGLNLQVHPDKVSNPAYVNEIKTLLDAIDSNRKNNRPLSSDQVEVVKLQLRAALLKLAKPPLGPLPDNIRIERFRP